VDSRKKGEAENIPKHPYYHFPVVSHSTHLYET